MILNGKTVDEEITTLLESIEKEKTYWLDIKNPKKEAIKTIESLYKIHPLIIEDILGNETIEKYEVFGNYEYFTMKVKEQELLHVLMIENLIISIHNFDYNKLQQNGIEFIKEDIIYSIIDDILDIYIGFGDEIINEIMFCEQIIYVFKEENEMSDIMRRFTRAKLDISHHLDEVHQKLKLIKKMISKSKFSEKMIHLLNEKKEEIKSAIDKLEYANKSIISSNSNYYSKIANNHQEEKFEADITLNLFFIITIIFIPFHIITAIFSMNIPIPYRFYPGLAPFYILVIVCIIISVIMIIIVFGTLYYFEHLNKFHYKYDEHHHEEDEDEKIFQILDENNLKFSSLKELLSSIGNHQWIDIQNPNKDEIKELVNHFHLHPLILDELLKNDDTEKTFIFKEFNYIIIQPEHQHIFHIIQMKDVLISIHYGPIHYIQDMLTHFKRYKQEDQMKSTTNYILFSILDSIIDHFIYLSKNISNEIRYCDEIMVSTPVYQEYQDLLFRMNKAKKSIEIIHLSLLSKKHLIHTLLDVNQDLQKNFQVYHQNIKTLSKKIEYLRNSLGLIFENYFTKISLSLAESLTRQKQFLAQVTALSIIQVSPSAFGENFRMNTTVPYDSSDSTTPFWVLTSIIVFLSFLMYFGVVIYIWILKKFVYKEEK